MMEVQEVQRCDMETLSELVQKFRTLVFAGITHALKGDGYHKVYEGIIELHISWPSYLVATDQDGRIVDDEYNMPLYELNLHCYVLGHQRHYHWQGIDARKLFERATADVNEWVAELDKP